MSAADSTPAPSSPALRAGPPGPDADARKLVILVPGKAFGVSRARPSSCPIGRCRDSLVRFKCRRPSAPRPLSPGRKRRCPSLRRFGDPLLAGVNVEFSAAAPTIRPHPLVPETNALPGTLSVTQGEAGHWSPMVIAPVNGPSNISRPTSATERTSSMKLSWSARPVKAVIRKNWVVPLGFTSRLIR